MEEKLDLSLNLKLKEVIMRRLVVKLWNESDMSAAVGTRTAARAVCKKVKKKISKFALPEKVKKRMVGLVRPVKMELVRFQWWHKLIFNDPSVEETDLRIWEQLCWTIRGIIDYRKTAEKLVRLQIIDIEKRYKIACSYCLENYIPVLWEELPEDYKSRFEGEIYHFPENVSYLEYYWAFVMMREESRLNSILPRSFSYGSSTYQSFFKYCACVESRAATEYFFQKLNDEERNGALCDAFGELCAIIGIAYEALEMGMPCEQTRGLGNRRSDILYYLLSLMTHEQQMQVLMKHNYICLLVLLVWPFETLFLDIADITWSFIPENQHKLIMKRVSAYYIDHHWPELFQEFFMRSPISFRKCFVDTVKKEPDVLEYYFRKGDEQTIRVVLQNLDPVEKVRLFSAPHLLRVLLFAQRPMVELCIGQEALSEEDRKKLKNTYTRFRWCTQAVIDSYVPNSETKFRQLFDVLDGASGSTNTGAIQKVVPFYL